jgi:hypothetical protein
MIKFTFSYQLKFLRYMVIYMVLEPKVMSSNFDSVIHLISIKFFYVLRLSPTRDEEC